MVSIKILDEPTLTADVFPNKKVWLQRWDENGEFLNDFELTEKELDQLFAEYLIFRHEKINWKIKQE